MSRPKKEGQYVNFYMDRSAFELLEQFSKETGLTKTVIMERAVKQYIDLMKSNKNLYISMEAKDRVEAD